MSVKLEFMKVDKRYKGAQHFDYFLVIKKINKRQPGTPSHLHVIKTFNEIRDWCIKNWGTSTEIDDYDIFYFYPDLYSFNQHWSWSIEKNSTRRIYFKTDQEYAWAKLTWN